MTARIWLLWQRPPLAIAFIKEHECALKESPGTQMVNISQKKKKNTTLFSTGLNYAWDGTIIATVWRKDLELQNLKSLLVYLFQIQLVKISPWAASLNIYFENYQVIKGHLRPC